MLAARTTPKKGNKNHGDAIFFGSRAIWRKKRDTRQDEINVSAKAIKRMKKYRRPLGAETPTSGSLNALNLIEKYKDFFHRFKN